MNKTIQIILLALSIIGIKSEFSLCEEFKFSSTPSDDNCMYLSTSTDRTHCCLFQAANETGRCMEITDDEYENIKRFKTFMKNTYDKVKIKCSSEYLSFTVLALIALLI